MTALTGRRLSNDGAVRLVGRAIASRTPAAVVRFGEGEGRVLSVEPGRADSLDIAKRKLAKQTGLIFSPEQILRVSGLLMIALQQADVVGIEYGGGFSAEHREWMQRIIAIHGGLPASAHRDRYVSQCTVNSDLYHALPTLLDGLNRLSLVSCRDLAPRLAKQGIHDVAVYQLPSQYVMRDVDDEYEAQLHDMPIWPDFYESLESGITVRQPGEVFLVGAGVFAKSLCIRIRDLGGIALDMGSTLDHMAEKTTRGRWRPAFRELPADPLSV